MNIKEFYETAYPTDDMGAEINPAATFAGLYRELDRYGDIYKYIGVGDSIIRERLMEKLTEIMGEHTIGKLFIG